MSAKCFLLNASSICGEQYNGYPLLSDSFSTQAAFDAFVKENIVNIDAVKSLFADKFGCTGADIAKDLAGRQFHVSFQCATSVHSAIQAGCAVSSGLPAAGPVLCNDPCIKATNSLRSIFSNAASCPSSALDANRNVLISQFENYCTGAASQSTGSCTAGISTEVTYCGFASSDAAAVGCKKLSNETCCQQWLKSTASDAKPFSLASIWQKNRPAVIAGIVALVIVLAILISTIVVIRRRRKARRVSGLVPLTKKPSEYEHSSSSPISNLVVGAVHEPELHTLKPLTPVMILGSPLADPIMHSVPTTSLTEVRSHVSSVTTSTASTPAYHGMDMSQNAPTILSSSHTASMTQNQVPTSPLEQRELYNKEGTRVIVVHPYEPTLSDELHLEVGTEVILVRPFDDGWALGLNPSSGQHGAFPLVCVSKPEDMNKKTKKRSSQSSTSSSLDRKANSKRMSPTQRLSNLLKEETSSEPKINKRVSSQFLTLDVVKNQRDSFYGDIF